MSLFISLKRREFAELLEKYGSNGSTGSTRNSPIQQGRHTVCTTLDIHFHFYKLWFDVDTLSWPISYKQCIANFALVLCQGVCKNCHVHYGKVKTWWNQDDKIRDRKHVHMMQEDIKEHPAAAAKQLPVVDRRLGLQGNGISQPLKMAYDNALIHYTITNICLSQEGSSQLVHICKNRVSAHEQSCVLWALDSVDTSESKPDIRPGLKALLMYVSGTAHTITNTVCIMCSQQKWPSSLSWRKQVNSILFSLRGNPPPTQCEIPLILRAGWKLWVKIQVCRICVQLCSWFGQHVAY